MSCIALIILLSDYILQIASQITTVKYPLLPNYVHVSLRHYLIFKVLLQISFFQIRNLIVFILGMQISNISPLLNLTTLSIFLEFVQLHPQIRFDYFCAINKHKIAKNYLKRKWYLHKINSLMPRIRNNYECQVNRKENYWDWKS